MSTDNAKLDHLIREARDAPVAPFDGMPAGFATRVVARALSEERAETLDLGLVRWATLGALAIMLACILSNLSVLARTPLTADLAIRQAMAELVFDR